MEQKEGKQSVEVVTGEAVVSGTNHKVIAIQGEYTKIDEDKDIVYLSNTYSFEGQEYDQIELSGMNDLSARDMIEAQKALDRSGNISFMPEMTLEYACEMASKATGIPKEFFYALKPKDAARLKNKVVSFFFGKE